MLAEVVPPDNSGRKAFLLSCGLLIALLTIFSLGCVFVIFTDATVTNFKEGKPEVLLLSLIAAPVLALPYFLVIMWLDRNEKEPPHLILSAFLWGAVIAVGISCVFNSYFGSIFGGQLTASFSAPFIEEVTKGAALLVIYLFFKKDFDNVMDGIVYGAVVGLGFAAVENFMYYSRTPDIDQATNLIILRGVIGSIGSHACYTALTGIGLGLFRVKRAGKLRYLFPIAGLMLAMFVHFAWNTFIGLFFIGAESDQMVLLVRMPIAVTVLQMPFVILVVLVSFFSLRHERKLIENYLSTETAPVLMPGELVGLVPARRRTIRSMKLFFTFKLAKWWRRKKRDRLLIRLAFEKWHMDQEAQLEDKVAGHYHAERVLSLRRELIGLKV